jgi:hypothetical protein
VEKFNLWQRINAVMKDVEYLNKDDNVSTGNNNSYKAISEEKVTRVVGAAIREHGLVILPIEQEHIRQDEQVKDKYGNEKTNRITTVNVKYKIVNIDNPAEFEILASGGTGVDTQDKGVGKAMTYAYKYLLLRTFSIATGDDPDKISSEEYDKNLKGEDKKEQQPEPKQNNKGVSGASDTGFKCVYCGKQVTEKVSTYSLSKFHKILCMDCQKNIK